MKYLVTAVVTLLSLCLFSCNKDDINKISPSSASVKFEGEGGRKEISFTNGNWEITKVVNNNNDRNIFGDIYSADGNLIYENHVLRLDSLGKLEAFWSDKGFTITRKTPTSIEVNLNVNFTKEYFDFTIVLESGNDLKRITIRQKPSQGYHVKDIQYTLETGDGDSLFFKNGEPYIFNINSQSTKQSVSISPFINIIERSHFESPDKEAFPWKKSDSVMVPVPTQITGNGIKTGGETSPYSNEEVAKDSKFKDLKSEKIVIPPGHSEFVTKIEYRKRTITYVLHLINNRTKKEKTVTGKWVETAPTGHYIIDWK